MRTYDYGDSHARSKRNAEACEIEYRSISKQYRDPASREAHKARGRAALRVDGRR